MKLRINILFTFAFAMFVASVLFAACQSNSLNESDSFWSKFQIQNYNIEDIYNNLKGRAELSRKCDEFETKAQCEERLLKRDTDEAQKPVIGNLTINDNFRFSNSIDSKYNADEQIMTFTFFLEINRKVANGVVAIAEELDPNSNSIFSRKGATPEIAKTQNLFGVTISGYKSDYYEINFNNLCDFPLLMCRSENAKSVLTLISASGLHKSTFEASLRRIETKIKVDVEEAKRLKNDITAVIEVKNLRYHYDNQIDAALVDIFLVDTRNNRVLYKLSDGNK